MRPPAGKAVPEVVDAIVAAGEQHKRRVSTATLNMVLSEATAWKAPPTQRRSLKKGRIYYATQVRVENLHSNKGWECLRSEHAVICCVRVAAC